jgi:alkylhydroperoxidase family enzyme
MSNDEARLPRVEPDKAPAEVKPTFDAFIAERGKVPNLFRVAAHVPEMASRLAAFNRVVMGPGDVPVVLKELLSVRVSHINNCEY